MKPKSKPMIIIMAKTVGKILINDLKAIIRDCFAFSRSLRKANIKQNNVKIFINIAVVLIVRLTIFYITNNHNEYFQSKINIALVNHFYVNLKDIICVDLSIAVRFILFGD